MLLFLFDESGCVRRSQRSATPLQLKERTVSFSTESHDTFRSPPEAELAGPVVAVARRRDHPGA
jgi:hypothetical protein